MVEYILHPSELPGLASCPCFRSSPLSHRPSNCCPRPLFCKTLLSSCRTKMVIHHAVALLHHVFVMVLPVVIFINNPDGVKPLVCSTNSRPVRKYTGTAYAAHPLATVCHCNWQNTVEVMGWKIYNYICHIIWYPVRTIARPRYGTGAFISKN